ncbi:amidohydrolase [Holophaga foetida]|uniref:amidohydrolase n=1 Tax=Holophaga foetida TaxID=35839 RepID=UPI0002471C8B|nr:amidohydrolase [Holophaga foetida]
MLDRNADLVVFNEAIYTLDPDNPWVEAFAVKDGRYCAVGSRSEVKAMIGADTRVVEMRGGMIMPGINDAHAHPLDGGYEDLFLCNFSPTASFHEILHHVAEAARKAEPGDWIIGGSWGDQNMEVMSSEAGRQALDRVSNGHPVFLRDISYHNRFVNSVVLQMVGIDRNSEAPLGCVFVKDPSTGEPTGLLKEFGAFTPIEARMPPRLRERLDKAAGYIVARLNSLGVTGIQDAYGSEGIMQVWSDLDRQQGLPLWLVGSIPAMPFFPGDRAGMELISEREKFRTPRVFPHFVKFFLDGVPPARTAKMLAPYLPEGGEGNGAPFHGEAYFEADPLAEAMCPYDQMGLPIMIHTTGDGAVRIALDAIEKVRSANGDEGPRHVLAHCSIVDPADYPRFRKLNVAVNLSPMLWFPTGLWLGSFPAIGPDRCHNQWLRNKDFVEAGALVSSGSDWPAGQTHANPWIGIEGMLTRRDPLGMIPGELGLDQALDLETVLAIYTINSAKAMGIDEVTGSMVKGKSADFIVLDNNLFEIPVDKIHQTQVRGTYFQGKSVFSC